MFDSKVHVLDHPLLQHKLSILRDERTGVKEFREIVSEIAALECYEATRDLPLEDVEIKTPVATGTFKQLAGKKLAIVPILRAGLGMVDGILTLIPSAKVGHIGLYRDPETLNPVEYYCKLPDDSQNREIFDPDATWKRKTYTDYEAQELMVPIFLNGELVYQVPDLQASRSYCQRQVDSLWDEVKRFENPHNYYVDLSQKLWDIKHELLDNGGVLRARDGRERS